MSDSGSPVHVQDAIVTSGKGLSQDSPKIHVSCHPGDDCILDGVCRSKCYIYICARV